MSVNSSCSAIFRKIVSTAFLIVMLSTASILTPVHAQTEEPGVQSFQNISVDTAYDMINNGSFLNLVVLDVRYQCEYNMGHLNGAVLIPCDQLEARISELEEHRNHEIIVNCRSGYRSQIACEILVKYNFTEVYNMVGGILAWIEAGYPIWTTFHYVTVDAADEEMLLQIEPLLIHQTGYVSCAQNQTCPSDGKPANITFTVLEQEENYTRILLAYEVNGTTFDITIAKTLLQSYNEHTDEANRTLDFVFTEITTRDSFMQFHSLSYLIYHLEYNITLYTTLSLLNSETYNSSFTTMNYAPAENPEVTSFEFVEINSSVTLSQSYTVLGKVAKEIGKVYEKSEDASLMPLAQAYSRMNEEAKNLSKLVEKRLTEHNHPILHISAVLMDVECGPCGCGGDECGEPPPPGDGIECTLCQLACPFLVIGCWSVCWFFPPICYYCSLLSYYYLVLKLGCYVACTLATLCP